VRACVCRNNIGLIVLPLETYHTYINMAQRLNGPWHIIWLMEQ